MKIIKEILDYRIIEVRDDNFDMEDLKGDTYEHDFNGDICPIVLSQEEKDFEDKINYQGVYGYVLEKWNAEIDQGWEHVDSCWGFVGDYEDEKHYIVDEFIDQVKNSEGL